MAQSVTAPRPARAIFYNEWIVNLAPLFGVSIVMDSLLKDLRYSLRLLGRSPLFTVTAVLSLAIGIGANTTIFTIVNAMLYRTPPGAADPARLIDIGRSQDGNGFDTNSYPNYLDARSRNRVFSDVYAYRFEPQAISLGGAGGAERIYGSLVTNNYFETLGLRPELGRLFSARDGEAEGATPFVVLTHHFWEQRFDSDRKIAGKTLVLNGHPFTVIGVAPPGFRGTTLFASDVWIPMNMIAQAMPRTPASMLKSRQSAWLMMGARLRAGVPFARAQTELARIGADLEREWPEANRGRGLRAVPLSNMPGNDAPIRAFLAGLMVLVTLVLAITCANLAGVLLARATSRQREIAMRLALGASRSRLVRQMLIETMTLFAAGALAGLVLARVLTSLLMSLLPALPVPVAVSLTLDTRVIAFTLGLSFIAAILCGLAPAFHASKRDVVTVIKASGQTTPERQRLRNAFVIAQVAFSVILVVAAGLFVRALQRAGTIDAGFDPHNVELASLDLSLGGYDETTGPRFARELLGRVRALPGVQSATLAAMLPLGLGGMSLEDITLPGFRELITADWNVVEPGSFETLRTPLLAGRDFNNGDRVDAPWVAIVNETMAHRLWPNQNAIGKTLRQGEHTVTIIGIARDVKYRSLGDPPRSFLYVPLQQQYSSRMTIVARTTRGQRLAREIRTVVASMNPNLPVVMSQTLEEFSSLALAPQRVAASVSGSLGLIGLLLAGIGIYGVTAYMVTTRTREIGIRVALGAERSDVIRMVLRRGMSLVIIGIVVGSLLAAAGSRVLSALLFGVHPMDPATYATSILLFCMIGLAACYVPARRATEVEATLALRGE